MYDRTMTALILLGVLVLCLLFSRRRNPARPLPPSLRGYPIIGHLFQLPFSDEHITYRNIGQELKSDLISFTVLGQVIVVLNSAEVARDLLSRRGAIYSDRPELPMLNDDRLLGWGKITGFLRYGERWRIQRAMTQAALHPNAGKDIWPRMVKQVRSTMQRLLYRPDNIAEEARWMTAAMILSSVYGYEASYPSDDLIQLVESAALHICQAAMPANFYVNTISWLKYVPSWFPGAGWKRKANLWRAEKERAINEPFDWTKSQMPVRGASPSILKNLLTDLGMDYSSKYQAMEEEDLIRWVVGTLYVAGADSTVASVMMFVLAMVLHPEVQKKAQAELDAVLGEDRLPELSDRESLPYVNAILKEVLRWRPVAPLGLPRACTQDNEYRGYTIPKGAIVIGNFWAMSNDPSVYPEPQDFIPERFMNTTVPAAPSFGFGRRDCPGAYLADSSLFIMASSFLTIFSFVVTPGKPVPEGKTEKSLLVSHPVPFDCTVIPRSEQRRRLIEQWVEV